MSPKLGPTADSAPAIGAEHTTGRTVVAGSSWTTATRVVPQLATLALSVAAARTGALVAPLLRRLARA